MQVDQYTMKVGTYYAFYIRESNRGDNIRQYAPVFEFKVTEVHKPYEDHDWVFARTAEIVDRNKLTKSLLSDMEHSNLIGHHGLTPEFYLTREEAEKEHDRQLNQTISGFKPDRKEKYKAKLYERKVSNIETGALKFFEGLSKREQSYVKWIAQNKVL